MFDATNPKRIPCNNQMNGKPYCLVDIASKCEDFSDSELCPSGDCDAVDLLKKCSGAGCGGVSSLACASQYRQEFGEGLKCQYQSDCPSATHEELRKVLKIVNTSTVVEEPGQCKQLKFQCFRDSCEIYFSPLHPGPDGEDVTWSCRPCSSSGVQFPGASTRQGDQECPDFCSCPCGCRFTAIHPGTNDVFSGTPVLGSNSLLCQGFLKQVWRAVKSAVGVQTCPNLRPCRYGTNENSPNCWLFAGTNENSPNYWLFAGTNENSPNYLLFAGAWPGGRQEGGDWSVVVSWVEPGGPTVQHSAGSEETRATLNRKDM